MKITVLNAIKAPGATDPIAESESLREFVEFGCDEVFFRVSSIGTRA